MEMTTVVDNPREGGVWISLNYDGRHNPKDLTEQDIEYITTALAASLRGLPAAKSAPEE